MLLFWNLSKGMDQHAESGLLPPDEVADKIEYTAADCNSITLKVADECCHTCKLHPVLADAAVYALLRISGQDSAYAAFFQRHDAQPYVAI